MMQKSAAQTPVYDRTWLERARRARGLRQSDVAEVAGCSTPFYNRIERGLHMPTVVIALNIADFLGVDVRNFLTERKIG